MEDASHGTLRAFPLTQTPQIIDCTSIISVVSMQKLPPVPGDPPNLWFVIEKSGIDDLQLLGTFDPLDEQPGEA